MLTSSGGKHLEDDIHCAGDSNVTSALCLEQRLLVPLHPVGCCAVRGAELLRAARPPRGTQPLSWGVSGEILQETFDLFIIHVLEGTEGSPACVLASRAVRVISLRVEKGLAKTMLS